MKKLELEEFQATLSAFIIWFNPQYGKEQYELKVLSTRIKSQPGFFRTKVVKVSADLDKIIRFVQENFLPQTHYRINVQRHWLADDNKIVWCIEDHLDEVTGHYKEHEAYNIPFEHYLDEVNGNIATVEVDIDQFTTLCIVDTKEDVGKISNVTELKRSLINNIYDHESTLRQYNETHTDMIKRGRDNRAKILSERYLIPKRELIAELNIVLSILKELDKPKVTFTITAINN